MLSMCVLLAGFFSLTFLFVALVWLAPKATSEEAMMGKGFAGALILIAALFCLCEAAVQAAKHDEAAQRRK